MRAEKRRNDVQGLIRSKFLVEAENFQFARCIQAIAAFCLDRCRTISGELRERLARASFQGFRCGGTQFFDGVQDAAALAGYLFVASASDFHLILFRAAGSMDQVSMRIDEPRQCHAAAEVQDLCAACLRKCLYRSASSERANQAVAHQQGSVLDDAEVGKRGAAPWAAAAERQEL